LDEKDQSEDKEEGAPSRYECSFDELGAHDGKTRDPMWMENFLQGPDWRRKEELDKPQSVSSSPEEAGELYLAEVGSGLVACVTGALLA
jgi:hypothetical protein